MYDYVWLCMTFVYFTMYDYVWLWKRKFGERDKKSIFKNINLLLLFFQAIKNFQPNLNFSHDSNVPFIYFNKPRLFTFAYLCLPLCNFVCLCLPLFIWRIYAQILCLLIVNSFSTIEMRKLKKQTLISLKLTDL